MRLREPFAGYMLSSGHFMFHMAYLVGSQIAVYVVLKGTGIENDKVAMNVLFQLNLAHILTPIFNFISIIATMNDYFILSKVCDTISIFQYQTTIFYA